MVYCFVRVMCRLKCAHGHAGACLVHIVNSSFKHSCQYTVLLKEAQLAQPGLLYVCRHVAHTFYSDARFCQSRAYFLMIDFLVELGFKLFLVVPLLQGLISSQACLFSHDGKSCQGWHLAVLVVELPQNLVCQKHVNFFMMNKVVELDFQLFGCGVASKPQLSTTCLLLMRHRLLKLGLELFRLLHCLEVWSVRRCVTFS